MKKLENSSTFRVDNPTACVQPARMTKKLAAQMLGKLGGKAGTGAAKARWGNRNAAKGKRA